MASRSKDSSTTAKIGGPRQRQSVAAVRLVRPVRVLRGPAMGQPQPVMLADLAVVACPTHPGVFDELLQQLLGDALDAGSGAKIPTGRDLADVVLRWAIALQRAARQPVFSEGMTIGAAPGTSAARTLVVPYCDSTVGRRAVAWAAKAVSTLARSTDRTSLIERSRVSTSQFITQLRQAAPRTYNAVNFLRAAHELEVPWTRLSVDVFQVGQGCRGRWLDSSLNDRTSHIGVRLARNKAESAAILRRAGIPVPDLAVTVSMDKAVVAAGRLRYPVVVKPADQDGGVGVAAGLEDEAALRKAYGAAAKLGPHVLVEKHIEGRDFRLFVVDGRVRWVVERTPGGVTGDGNRSVAELLGDLNADPRRGPSLSHPLRPIDPDEEALGLLRRQGLTPDSVPEAGRFVRLRRITNVARGGMPVVCAIDQVHPDNLRLAERAAEALRLDVAGVDFITPDIGRPWHEVPCGINEVNAQPSLGLLTAGHLFPEILRWLLDDTDGRIPTVVVVGEDAAASTAVASTIHAWLVEGGSRCGLATHEGAWVGAERVAWSDMSGIGGGQLLLGSPQCEAAVMVVNPVSLRAEGQAFDRCDVVVRLTTGPVACPFEAALLRGARQGVVMSAGDGVVVDRIRRAVAAPLVLCGPAADSLIIDHVAHGGAAVCGDGDSVVVHNADPHLVLAVSGKATRRHLYAQAALVALREPREHH